MRIWHHTLVWILTPLAALAQTEGHEDILIGVRVDTPPFVSVDTNSGAYVGYFYDICTTAVTRAGYQFVEESVNAETRNSFLTNGAGGYDVLCDPTTITLSRMGNFATGKDAANEPLSGTQARADVAVSHLNFSQIVFVANGAYATPNTGLDEDWEYRLEQAVKQGENKNKGNAADIIQECASLFDDASQIGPKPEEEETKPPGKLSDYILFRYKREASPPVEETPIETTVVQVLGYVIGSTIRETVLEYKSPGIDSVACTFPSHEDAAAAFCEGKLDRYYGDLDIIRSSIAKHNDKSGAECTGDFAPVSEFTYEPYAFVVSSRIPDFPEQFNCALYSMFEDGTIQTLYTGNFGEDMQPYLNTLFRINSIPAGNRDEEGGTTYVCGVGQ